jgi:hypothetical protein
MASISFAPFRGSSSRPLLTVESVETFRDVREVVRLSVCDGTDQPRRAVIEVEGHRMVGRFHPGDRFHLKFPED